MKYQVPIIAALVVILIIIFWWRRKGKEKLKGRRKKGAKVKPKTKARAKKSGKSVDEQLIEDELEELDEEEEEADELVDDARELYNLVHEDLAGGMQYDEFEEQVDDGLVGDDPAEVFVELKQKYTEAADKNMDPMRAVTVQDYVKVLKHT